MKGIATTKKPWQISQGHAVLLFPPSITFTGGLSCLHLRVNHETDTFGFGPVRLLKLCLIVYHICIFYYRDRVMPEHCFNPGHHGDGSTIPSQQGRVERGRCIQWGGSETWGEANELKLKETSMERSPFTHTLTAPVSINSAKRSGQ
jgi:hypothetical protein